jgi:hypothetical protein
MLIITYSINYLFHYNQVYVAFVFFIILSTILNKYNFHKIELIILFIVALKLTLFISTVNKQDVFVSDSIAYYDASILSQGIKSLTDDIIGGTAFIIKIISTYLHTANPIIVVSFNYILLLISAILWLNINNYDLLSKISSLLLVLSPEVDYYTGLLLKESYLLFFAMSILYCYKRKIYFFPVVLLLLGTAARPYFIAAIFSYMFYLKLLSKVQMKIAYVSMSFIFMFLLFHWDLPIKLDIIIRNLFLATLGFSFSPNILRIVNWESYPLQSLQSFMFIILILIYLCRNIKGFIQPFTFFIMSIFLYVAPATLSILKRALISSGDEWLFATEIPRTRICIVLILYHFIALIITRLFISKHILLKINKKKK